MELFEIKGKPTHEKKLIQLETLLNIEIPVSGTLFLMWWLIPGTALLFIFVVAMILLPLFTIALGVLLFQLRKFGWFSALILFVVLPLCAIPFFNDGSATYPFYYVLPLAFFGFYSITIRLVMPYWEG
ncbi:MAG: hypothetical protein R3220_06390 [Balneolaceae bacterium]|nr:hypothetical protein [Balneolaceae bacterium]